MFDLYKSTIIRSFLGGEWMEASGPPASPQRQRDCHEDLRQHPRWAPTNRRRSWKSHPWFTNLYSVQGGYSQHFTNKKLKIIFEILRYCLDFTKFLSQVLGKRDRSHNRFWSSHILPVGICCLLYVKASDGSNKVPSGQHASLFGKYINSNTWYLVHFGVQIWIVPLQVMQSISGWFNSPSLQSLRPTLLRLYN